MDLILNASGRALGKMALGFGLYVIALVLFVMVPSEVPGFFIDVGRYRALVVGLLLIAGSISWALGLFNAVVDQRERERDFQ